MHKNTVFQLYQFYNTSQLAPRSLEALATHCLIIWMQGSHHHREKGLRDLLKFSLHPPLLNPL